MDLELRDRLNLNRVNGFPVELLQTPPADLWRHLPGPTLFSIDGHNEAPLFVSVLLHGNESTGWEAIQSVMAHHRSKTLPRALLLFVGNIAAARENVRTCAHQTDYNRCWPGTALNATIEAALMREVVAEVQRAKPFASIDVHNNTGHNPHYACLNRLDEPYLHLARLFSRTVVYFERPLGVQSAALAEICPAVTVECGMSGGAGADAHAAEFIDAALSLDHFPEHSVPEGDIDLMQTTAILKVPSQASISFDGSDAEFKFRPDLDLLNFSELQPGISFGQLGGTRGHELVIAPGGSNATQLAYLTYEDGTVRLAQPAIPAMLTKDERAIRLDCLGYLMHRIARDGTMKG